MGSCAAHAGFCSMWERLLVLFQKSATCSNTSSPVSHSNLILKELLTQGSFLHPKTLLGCQEEKAGIWVWDLSASTSVPFRGSLQPSVVGISLSWWRERHCCGTIPATKPSVFLTGFVFHLLKHSGSRSSGNLWSTKVKLARTPGFYPNCTLLLSQVPPEHGWLSKCSTENAPAQPSVITSERPGSREKLGTAERQEKHRRNGWKSAGKSGPASAPLGESGDGWREGGMFSAARSALGWDRCFLPCSTELLTERPS